MQDESENVVQQYEYARRVRDTSRLLFSSLCRHWQTRQQVLVGHTRTRHSWIIANEALERLFPCLAMANCQSQRRLRVVYRAMENDVPMISRWKARR
jgi:hypothetical protein